jgi:cytoskeleton protein RodZ
LRKARELRGESLEAVAETLNLRPDVLAGLERGDYSVLPSPAYTGPFVRSYAKYLELDAEALASQARAEVSVGEDLGGFAQARQVPSKPSRSLFLILAVILVVVGGIAWAFTQWGGQLTTAESMTERGAGSGSAALEAGGQDTAAAAAPASEDSAEAGMAADTRTGQAGTEPEAADAASAGATPVDTQSAAENTAPSNRAGEPAPLEVMPVARTFGPGDMSNGPALQAEREAWLRVENADGLVVFVGRLQSGDVFAALEGKGFVASVRDAGAFRVLYDGSPVARLGDDGIARPTVILDRFGQMG